MAKQWKWNITLNGQGHEVICDISSTGNGYILYVDDEYLTKIYRKTGGGIDEEVTICGEVCRFVVWDERPDLVVDGKLMTGKASYAETAGKLQRVTKIKSWFVIVIGLLAILFYAVLTVCGEDMSRYNGAVVLGGLLVLDGVLGLRGQRK